MVRLGIQKNDAFQVRQKFLHRFIEQVGHVVEVNTPALVQGDEQRLFRRADRFNRLPVMNRAFGKNRGLGRALRLVVVVLQRKQQRQIGVAVEGALVGANIHRAKAPDKTVVSQVELLPRFEDTFLGAAVHLRTQTIPHRIADWNQIPDARAGFGGQVGEWTQNIFLTDADHAIMQTIGVGFYEIRRGNGFFERRLGDLV